MIAYEERQMTKDDQNVKVAMALRPKLKTLKTFIATVCQYNTIQCYLSTECIQNQFFISKRLYIKTRGPNCKL